PPGRRPRAASRSGRGRGGGPRGAPAPLRAPPRRCPHPGRPAAPRPQRLLRQPGGFESLGRVEVLADPNRPAIRDVNYPAGRRLRFDPTFLAADAKLTQRHDSVSEAANLRDLALAPIDTPLPLPDRHS